MRGVRRDEEVRDRSAEKAPGSLPAGVLTERRAGKFPHVGRHRPNDRDLGRGEEVEHGRQPSRGLRLGVHHRRDEQRASGIRVAQELDGEGVVRLTPGLGHNDDVAGNARHPVDPNHASPALRRPRRHPSPRASR